VIELKANNNGVKSWWTNHWTAKNYKSKKIQNKYSRSGLSFYKH